ncbi:hypothetical protein [Nitrobacter winogradskyi]|uniref:Uncharacterized protein n=2 Tax=Nitrobacter winogradskyi TaxID=913 RepID=A0ACC6AHI0_NITWI|nr:hypothetical protein [Nitrobacter winogradskyi]MCP1998849.1 hypothetical protein [Nitrobacter winogradskyi]GEC14230.1 hypothetical protein NWI01_01220 [Nitrobacter winogradskyi]
MTLLQPIGSLVFSLGAALAFLAGWMRLCDSGSDLAGKVLGVGVTLLLLGWLMMECAGDRVA